MIFWSFVFKWRNKTPVLFFSPIKASGCCVWGNQSCLWISVEALQRVRASQKLFVSHLSIHSCPAFAWETGKWSFLRACMCACRHLWDSVADLCLLLLQAEFVWHKLSADNMDPDFVERRRVGLENFLLRVATHPALSNDKIFYSFLTEVTWEKLAKDPAYLIIL